MPGSQTVKHATKDLTITFTQDNHLYVDSNDQKYMSVTTLISLCFPKFDTQAVAKRCAEKRGVPWQQIVDEWNQAGKKASALGTMIHENCEYQMKQQFDKMHGYGNDMKLKSLMEKAVYAVQQIREQGDVILKQPEKIVFSPALKIAGSIDLLVSRKGNHYTIYDWKILSKGLQTTAFGGQTGCVPGTYDLQNSNYWHYALQLQIYEIILKLQGYIPKDAIVNRVLNVFTDGKLQHVQLPDLKRNVKQMLKWHCTPPF